ncbi:MAG: helix-turn-helix transcriptional regulator [Rickettsiales bacterium]|nr:helix-turn-helix transcriptional regulator [Rickettsiales bacterium]
MFTFTSVTSAVERNVADAKALLAEALSEARANSGFTEQEVAEKAQISVKRLQDYESGRTSPDSATVVRLAGLYGVPIAGMTNQAALSEAEISELIGNLMHHDEVGRGDQFKALIKSIKTAQGE